MFRILSVTIVTALVGCYLGAKYPEKTEETLQTGLSQLGVERQNIKTEQVAVGLASLLGAMLAIKNIGGSQLRRFIDRWHVSSMEKAILKNWYVDGRKNLAHLVQNKTYENIPLRDFLVWAGVVDRLQMAKKFGTQEDFERTLEPVKTLHRRLLTAVTNVIDPKLGLWKRFDDMARADWARSLQIALSGMSADLAALKSETFQA